MEQTRFDIQYSAMRSAIIEREFARLNDRQREAVFHTEGPMLVLAGAGSGKTTVLIHRIINLLRFGRGYSCEYAPEDATEEDLLFLREYLRHPAEENRMRAEMLCCVEPARPWQILAITFTNKAAKEIQQRLQHVLGEEFAKDIWASTFHSACVRILRRECEALGYDRSFTIYDTDDQKRVLNAIVKNLHLDEKVFDARSVMGAIGRAKDHLQTPRMYALEHADDYYHATVA
ncbi:MAG: UvrD-helicase domain-containing protein, partial [Eubacteriales bacterium]|nr:UvrD-helicase domain-containing protein [Eubacteriales bacterium]